MITVLRHASLVGGSRGGGGGGSSFGPSGANFENGVQLGNGRVVITWTV